MLLYFWSSIYIFTAFASSLPYPIVREGGFDISYRFDISVGKVVKLSSKGNVDSAICCTIKFL
jgi:hypothetical protein